MKIAVAVNTFGRPDYLVQALDALKIANQDLQYDVHFFHDGYRSDILPIEEWETALGMVNEYIALAPDNNELWLSPVNEGCNVQVYKPFIRLIDKYDAIMGLADDQIFLPGALHFVTTLLERYKSDQRIGQIAIGGKLRTTEECLPEALGNLIPNSTHPWLVTGRWSDRLKKNNKLMMEFITEYRKNRSYVTDGMSLKEDSFYYKFPLRKGRIRTIAPWISRVTHIGRDSSRDNFKKSQPPEFFQEVRDPSLVSHYDIKIKKYTEQHVNHFN